MWRSLGAIVVIFVGLIVVAAVKRENRLKHTLVVVTFLWIANAPMFLGWQTPQTYAVTLLKFTVIGLIAVALSFLFTRPAKTIEEQMEQRCL